MKTSIWCVLFTIAIVASQSLARADEKSHRQATEEFLQAINIQQSMEAAINQMVDMQMKSNPQLAPLRDVLKQWATNVLSYASLKDDLIAIYSEELSEDELKQLTAFYKSPVGKRWTDAGPKINAKASQLGASKAQAHQAELQKMIQEEQSKHAK